MRINAKGLHWTVAKLADGTTKTYWYAWRGGPRLVGEYGSPEFIASYYVAVATKIAAPEGRLLVLTQGYQQSQDFLSLRERTRRLHQADHQDRAAFRRCTAQGTFRPAHARNLPRLARRAGAAVEATSRLRLDGF